MLYPRELIEEIRLQNDIVDVVSGYLPLKQKGNSYFGLCPFHNEKTPSFSVNREKQFYYCFGCGVAGNVYGFIMQMENCDFVEAVKRLADRVNMTLPEPELSEQAKEKEQLRQRLFEIHTMAGRLYYEILQEPQGKATLEYLKGRQVLTNTQKKFGLGYAPSGRQTLYTYLKEKGFSEGEMVKSGLVMENKNGSGHYDRFYNRLMFPIFDAQGRVVAFGGRIMEKGEPKYLNSPETTLFSKSKHLYGLNFAKAAKKKELIIVEGYMDMISIYQAGFHNVVASLGTAFNQEHAKALKKYAEDIILLYDSDEAGTNAALRAIPVLTSNGFRVRVLQVPDGKDPDDFIKQNGAMAFSKLLVNAVHYISFQISCIKRNYNLQNTEHRVRFTTEAAETLAKLESDIERDVYTGEVARMTGIEEKAIKNEIRKIREKDEAVFTKEAESKRLQRYTDGKIKSVQKSKGILEAQRDILFLGASNLKIYEKLKQVIKPMDFIEPVYQKAARLIGELHEKCGTVFPAEIVSYFESVEEQKAVTEIFAVQLQYESKQDMEKAFNEELKLIKRANIDKMASEAVSVDDIKTLLEAKRKLDELYITISDG